MTGLSDEIAACERMKNGLETDHFGRWALVHREELIGTYESFESAADDAVRKFGEGPYLIRQIGVPAPSLPASVLYRPVHAYGSQEVNVHLAQIHVPLWVRSSSGDSTAYVSF